MAQAPVSKPRKRVALGKPIVHTDDELTALAAVTPEEIAAAQALVRASSPRLAAIMDAQPKDRNAANS